MEHRDTFSSYHPLINFLFFALVLALTMFVKHPLCLTISLVCALLYDASVNGRQKLRLTLTVLLPLMLITALINVAFNHEGATILTWLPTGNPLTLESFWYGLAAAALLAGVILWFDCYTAVMTSDKFVYLFGRIIPALSLVLSMTLRYIPRFRSQYRVVSQAQRCIGRGTDQGNLFRRFRNGVTIFSILVTWSLENAIESSDSMRSRGYGLPGRTAFSIYRFDSRDRAALVWLLGCGTYLVCAALAGGFAWHWYPTAGGWTVTPFTASFQLVWLALCLTPVIINWKEDRKWTHSPSKI